MSIVKKPSETIYCLIDIAHNFSIMNQQRSEHASDK
jgi:hypothetical protein